jgi:hypothetical protein
VIRLLVANGCSQTRGAELADPETQAWPALLARELGIPHLNMARDGSSNRRIVRTTVARLPLICEEARVSPQEVLVLIAWTHTVRHEFHVPGKRPEPTAHHAVDHNWEDIGPWRQQAGHRQSRAFYDHLWSDEGQIANLFLDWLLLDRYLQQMGYIARYAFAGPESPRVVAAAQWFTRQLPVDTTFGGIPPQPGMSFLEMVKGRAHGPAGHPLEDSHIVFAGALAQWLAL